MRARGEVLEATQRGNEEGFARGAFGGALEDGGVGVRINHAGAVLGRLNDGGLDLWERRGGLYGRTSFVEPWDRDQDFSSERLG